MDPVRLLDLGKVSFVRSQAVYHALAEAMTADTPDTLILLVPDRPYFCVGYHQDPRQVLDLEFCRRAGYPVLRRRVGGGATYLDSQQLFYQMVFHHTRVPQTVEGLYKFCLGPVLNTLRDLGLAARLKGINQPTIEDRRVAGTGAARIGEASVVVGNFLVDFDYAVMAQAWRVPSEEFRRLAREGLERHVTTLRREMGSVPSVETLKNLLIHQAACLWGRPIRRGELTAQEWTQVHRMEKRLCSRRWLFAAEPGATSPHRYLKIAEGVYVTYTRCSLDSLNGVVEVVARTRDGVLEALSLQVTPHSDSLPWSTVARLLEGCVLDLEVLEAKVREGHRQGLLPSELNLTSLLGTLVELSRLAH